ncbi:MAG TPA: hypothetical protein VJG67_00880 [Candidatus Paceibacterota bacterium]
MRSDHGASAGLDNFDINATPKGAGTMIPTNHTTRAATAANSHGTHSDATAGG